VQVAQQPGGGDACVSGSKQYEAAWLPSALYRVSKKWTRHRRPPIRLNYQFGSWVFGFETDIRLSGQKGGATFPGVGALTTITTDEKLVRDFADPPGIPGDPEHPALWHGRCCVRSGQGHATLITSGVGSFTASRM
jgi:hypothetical protein